MVDDTSRIDGYARALLAVADAEGEASGVGNELFQVARAFSGSDELTRSLSDPLVPFERKETIVSDLLGSRVSKVTISLLNMLIGAGRIKDLGSIAARMGEMAAASREMAIAEVRTAVELDEATIARLVAKLSAVTGQRVTPRVVVDPSVVGGIVAKVGDTVFDGSVRSRLQELREAWA
jgi:F-type H+-transporting ATPase subunit delta